VTPKYLGKKEAHVAFSYLAQYTLDRYAAIYQINGESNRQKKRMIMIMIIITISIVIIIVIMPDAPCIIFSYHMI